MEEDSIILYKVVYFMSQRRKNVEGYVVILKKLIILDQQISNNI